MENKRCSVCALTRPIEDFYIDRGYRRADCKPCHAARCKAYRATGSAPSLDPAYQRAYAHTWYDANRERLKAVRRAWYEANRELAARQNQIWYAANRERVAPMRHAWKSANKDRSLDYWHQRRARKADSDLVSRAVVYERDNGICGICRLPVDPADWHLDHIHPLSAGGSHSYDNIQVAHPRCNLSKGRKVA